MVPGENLRWAKHSRTTSRPQIPEFYGAVIARRGDPRAVRAIRHTSDHVRMSTQDEELAPGRGLPDPDAPVATARRHLRPVRAEGQAAHRARVPLQSPYLIP